MLHGIVISSAKSSPVVVPNINLDVFNTINLELRITVKVGTLRVRLEVHTLRVRLEVHFLTVRLKVHILKAQQIINMASITSTTSPINHLRYLRLIASGTRQGPDTVPQVADVGETLSLMAPKGPIS